jgi:hypothetical protein
MYGRSVPVYIGKHAHTLPLPWVGMISACHERETRKKGGKFEQKW